MNLGYEAWMDLCPVGPIRSSHKRATLGGFGEPWGLGFRVLFKDPWHLKFKGKHGHYFAKKNKKAEKNKENDNLRIIESTFRVAKGSQFAFCSSVRSPETKDQVGGKREQSAHCRAVP
uniref:Uncharacterized protein n=1 Tax=Solanum tuberosum TaxID=4113 RepID=M1DBH7_SOLTU